MIVEYTNERFDECVLLVHKLNKNDDTVRYYPTDIEKIKNKRRQQENSPKVTTLLYLEAGRVIGLLDCNTIESESYIQILSIFVDGNYDVVSVEFFDCLKIKFTGYSGHFVVSDFSHKAIKFLNKTNAINTGQEIMLQLYKDDYDNNKFINSRLIRPSEYASFTALHDTLNFDVYWTASLLLKNKDFSIVVNSINNDVREYAVVTNKRVDNEIYFLEGLTYDSKIKLLHQVLNIAFITSDVVIFAIKGEDDMLLYKTVGFSVQEMFITYEINF